MTFPPNSGVNISNTLPRLHNDSWVEAPVVIQASIPPFNLIQVGAFTGIYGGKLGHSRIGRYCSIAPGVDIASDQHPNDWLSTSMIQYVANVHGWDAWLNEHGFGAEASTNRFASNSCVEIGNDVWIGQGVFIKSGVKIGDGAIVAAHSVIVNDVPPYAIVAGVPGVIKRYRFDEKIIERLISIAWWQYNIKSIASKVDFSNVSAAIDTIQDEISAGRLAAYDAPRFNLNSKNAM